MWVVDAERIAETFVELADTLVDAFDVLDLLHTLTSRCVELLDVDEAAMLLADSAGRLRGTVATSQGARLLDRFQMEHREGPWLECYRTGAAVAIERIDEAGTLWPEFATEATSRGFTSLLALPMRLRQDTIGVLNLLAGSPPPSVRGRSASPRRWPMLPPSPFCSTA
jgi:GAF domain-containing protein